MSFTDKRLHYHRKQNEGTVSATRNKGLELASGEFIAFLDADDVWLPSKLERQMELFLSRPEIGVVYWRERYYGRGAGNSHHNCAEAQTRGFHVHSATGGQRRCRRGRRCSFGGRS